MLLLRTFGKPAGYNVVIVIDLDKKTLAVI